MNLDYPLEKVLEIKRRRVEAAEKNVKLKEQALEKERDILKEKEAERDKIKEHKIAKLAQLRHEMDTGTTTDKIQQAKIYLKLCDEKVIVEEKKVAEQKEQVSLAERQVEIAKEELRQRRVEVDKLVTHKKDWTKERLKELEVEEARDQDELGSITFNLRKRRGF